MQLSGAGQPKADFSIQGPGDHSVGGLVNLYGIESPGAPHPTLHLLGKDRVAAAETKCCSSCGQQMVSNGCQLWHWQHCCCD